MTGLKADFLSLQLEIFELIGLQQFHPSKYLMFFHALHILSILSMVFATLTEFFFIALNVKDILSSAEAFGPFSTEIISLTKYLTFFIWKDKFYSLINQIRDLSAQGRIV